MAQPHQPTDDYESTTGHAVTCTAVITGICEDDCPASSQSPHRALLARLEAERAHHETCAQLSRTGEARIAHSSMAAGLHLAAFRLVEEFDGPEAAREYMQRTTDAAPPEHHTAAQVEPLTERLGQYADRAIANGARAGRAEAALARVRAECDAIARDVQGKNPVALAGYREANARIRAALEPVPADTTQKES